MRAFFSFAGNHVTSSTSIEISHAHTHTHTTLLDCFPAIVRSPPSETLAAYNYRSSSSRITEWSRIILPAPRCFDDFLHVPYLVVVHVPFLLVLLHFQVWSLSLCTVAICCCSMSFVFSEQSILNRCNFTPQIIVAMPLGFIGILTFLHVMWLVGACSMRHHKCWGIALA